MNNNYCKIDRDRIISKVIYHGPRFQFSLVIINSCPICDKEKKEKKLWWLFIKISFHVAVSWQFKNQRVHKKLLKHYNKHLLFSDAQTLKNIDCSSLTEGE